MKNRIINYSILSILSLLFLWACQTDLQSELEESTNINKESLSVESAKKWLTENYGDVLNVSGSSARISGDKSEREVKWNKGLEKQIKTAKGVFNVVIFPVKIKKQKNILEDASLWVIKENGVIYSKFLELYNADYHKMNKKETKQQNYKQQFTGSLNIYDIKNGFEIGHYYENGKISGMVTSFNGEKASFVNTKKGAKTNWCYPRVVCPDVNGSVVYLSSTGFITVSVGRCVTSWACEQYFIYDGDPSYDDAYWDYFWQNVESNNNFVESTNSPGARPLAQYNQTDMCTGLSNMWNMGIANSHKEVYGVIATDGTLLITQISPYTTGGQFNGIYEHQGTMYYFFPKDGGAMPLISGTIDGGSSFYIPISATIHTHTPAILDGTDGITNQDGTDDFPFASRFPLLTNYVIGNNAIGKFNGNSYYDIKTGSLSTTCSNIK